jgi:hypothetical protein
MKHAVNILAAGAGVAGGLRRNSARAHHWRCGRWRSDGRRGRGIGRATGDGGRRALVGGGAGAATGAATSPQQVNLGKPPWTNPETRVPTPNGPVGPGRTARTDRSHDSDADHLNAQELQRMNGG